MLYDITSLFTSVPVRKALNIIHNKLVQDQRLTLRTKLTMQHIIEILRVLPPQHIFPISKISNMNKWRGSHRFPS